MCGDRIEQGDSVHESTKKCGNPRNLFAGMYSVWGIPADSDAHDSSKIFYGK